MKRIKYSFILLLVIISLFQRTYAQDLGQTISQITLDANPFQVEWSADGAFVAIATNDGAKIYNATGQLVDQFNAGYWTFSISWSPVDNQLAVTRQTSFEIWAWNSTNTSFELEETIETYKDTLIVEWNSDGQKLATLGVEEFQGFNQSQLGTIEFWDTSTWQLSLTVPNRYRIGLNTSSSLSAWFTWNPTNASQIVVLGAAVDSQGQTIQVGNSRRYLTVLDANTGAMSISIPTNALMFSVSWSPSREIIAVGTDLGVALYDVASTQLISFYPIGIDVRATAWSPDGSILIGDQGVVAVSISRVLGELPDVDGAIVFVDWNYDGTRLARITDTGSLQIIDTTTFPNLDGTPTVTPFITQTATPSITPTPAPGN